MNAKTERAQKPQKQTTSGPGLGDGKDELQMIAIDQIKPYADNPRRGDNPEYGRIKASIATDGVCQPLVVTQRPGEAFYTVLAGGNTRLRIVTELFAETGDAQFAVLGCVVRPWRDEAEVLVSHLKENDLRGELTFIDKALAVDKVKQLLEADGKEVKQLDTAAALNARGYDIARTLLPSMAYAAERLLPVIPVALDNGLGRPQVEKIRALDRVAARLWRLRGIEPSDEYDEVFAILCKRYDEPNWDIDRLRRALEAEIADRCDVNLMVVSMAIETGLAGRQWTKEDLDWETQNYDDQDARGDVASGGVDSAQDSNSALIRPLTSASDAKAGNTSDVQTATTSHKQQTVVLSDPALDALESSEEIDEIGPMAALRPLRARALTLAGRLAERHGLGPLVMPLFDQGLGFALHDVPDTALLDRMDDDDRLQVSLMWWQLVACSDLTAASPAAVLPAIAPDSPLYDALSEGQLAPLMKQVLCADFADLGQRLWRRLSEPDFRDLLSLMDCYRATHRTAESNGCALWGDAP